MGDDFFFAPPPPPGHPPQGPPGYGAPPPPNPAAAALPRGTATTVAAVAALSSVLMLIGAFGPWVTIHAFGVSQTGGGMRSGLDGRYILALGIAAMLAAGTAVTAGQDSKQVRQVCAGALVVLGITGLIVVIHEWGSITTHVRQLNGFINSFGSALASNTPGGSDPFGAGFSLHVSRDWGLWLSGFASVVAGLAGAYLFLV